MDSRRDILTRLRRRERRLRLVGLCAVTALLCGAIVAVVMPEVLVGEERQTQTPAVGAAEGVDLPEEVPGPLRLSEYLRLGPGEVNRNARRWDRMSERERGRYYASYWRLAELEDGDRAELFERYRTLRRQPPQRQELLRAKARELRQFIDEELGPQDQAILNRLPPEERAERILELWQARQGG